MHNDFMEDYFWLFMLGIVAFTGFVAYIVNKYADPSEVDEDEDQREEINLDGTHNED